MNNNEINKSAVLEIAFSEENIKNMGNGRPLRPALFVDLEKAADDEIMTLKKYGLYPAVMKYGLRRVKEIINIDYYDDVYFEEVLEKDITNYWATDRYYVFEKMQGAAGPRNLSLL